ncbi:MAG: RIP metalloprotease RseP [Bacteroidales bacterium]|nr:RIP metalloprotease RseP [Bacteroidales bacterium]
MKWLALLLSLSLLVMTHELGHLCFAKLFHTRVRRYYIFFNWKFSIIKAKKFNGKWHFLFFNSQTPEEWDEKNLKPEDQNNTLWGLGWIPLGGYCDIAGMIDETKSEEDLESVPQPWEYRTKPAWQRLLIISGGVLVNFLSALLLYTLIFAHWGQDELPLRNASLGYTYHQVMLDEGFINGDIIYAIDGKEMFDYTDATRALLLDNARQVMVMRNDTLTSLTMSGHLAEKVNSEQVRQIMAIRAPFVVKDFVAGSAAKKAGMLAGDSVVSIDGIPMACYDEITNYLSAHAGRDIIVGFVRNRDTNSALVSLATDGKMGVLLETDLSKLYNVKHIEYSIWEAIPAGISHGWKVLTSYVSSLKMLFAPGGVNSLGGFGTMSSIFPEYWDWQSFWSITAFLALILAFMNIIPIPGLDGGHIMFTLWEIITRKKPSERFLTIAQNIGMFLLIALMVLANGNDLVRWIKGML